MARNTGSFNTYNGQTGVMDETLFTPALETKTAAQWIAANPILLIGEMVQESDTGLIKVGDGKTAYKNLKHYGTYAIFSIRMASDLVVDKDIDIIPFGIPTGKNEKNITDFSEVLGDGRIKIKKEGYYRASGQYLVSDASSMVGTFHFGMKKQGDILIAENYNPTSSRAGKLQCSGNFCKDYYLSLNDVLTTFIYPPSRTPEAYRVDALFTTVSITPIYI